MNQRWYVETAACDRSQGHICHPPGNLLTHQLVLSVIHTAVSSRQPSAAPPIIPTCVPLRSPMPMALDGLLQTQGVSCNQEPRIFSRRHESLYGKNVSTASHSSLGTDVDFLLVSSTLVFLLKQYVISSVFLRRIWTSRETDSCSSVFLFLP